MLRGGQLLFPRVLAPVVFSSQATGLTDQASNPFTFTHTALQDDDVVVDVCTNRNNSLTGVTYGGKTMSLKGLSRYAAPFGNAWNMKFALPKVAAGNNTVSVNGGAAWDAAECIAYRNVNRFGNVRRARGSSTSMSQAVVVPASGMAQHLFTSTVNMSSLTGGNTRSYRNGSSIDVAIRDAAANATMAGTLASSSPWLSTFLPLLADDSGPYFNGVWGMAAATLATNQSFVLPNVVEGENVAVDVVVDRAGTVVNFVTVGGEDTFLLQSQQFTGISGLGTHYRFVMQASTSGDKTIAINTNNASAWVNSCAISVGNFAGTGTTVSGNGSSSVPTKAVTPIGGLSIVSFAMANGGSLPNTNGTFLWDSWFNNNCSIHMFVTDRAETLALTNSTNWSYIETPLY